MKKLMFLTVAAAAFAAQAMDVSAWRGETLFVTFKHVNGGESSVPYKPAFEELPAGFTGRIGLARPIKFEREPNSGEFITADDRVLWGAEEPYLASGKARTVAFEVKVSADARPGQYHFRAGGEPVNLRVVNRVLPEPKDWKYYLDLWQHPWAVSRWENVKPFSKEHYAAMKPHWEMLASAGQKVITATITKLPWNHQCFDGYDTMVRHIRTKDGWTFDYSVFDEYVAFCQSCGLGPDISCYTMCPWKYYVYGEDEKGNELKILAKPGSKEFEDFWKPFLIDFKKHLQEKGWFDRTAISMDERAPEDMRIISKFIKEYSGLKIATAGNFDPTKFPEIDLYSYAPVVDTVTGEFLKNNAARIKDPKKITTYYVCCVPYKPNTFMESKPAEAFWCGFFPAAKGLGGFLRWAYNSWPYDPRHDASFGNWRAGDTFFVYPDGDPSVRFLELRNGIQAAEKFRILRESGEDPAPLNALAAKYDYWQARKEAADLAPLKAETLSVVNCDPGD